MPVNIRLMRMGAKKKPFYRIVAADSRRARDGRFLEIVGTYNPVTNPAVIKVHEDKITNWLNEGAQTTPTVGALLTQIGFVEKYEKARRGEDVSEITIKEHIAERKKKTRKMKKAALAAEEAAKIAEQEKAKAAEEAAKAAEEGEKTEEASE